MCFKWVGRSSLTLLLIFVFSGLFGADRWNIVIGDLRDLSSKPDKNMGLIIRKSIETRLQKENSFTLIAPKGGPATVTSYSEALQFGRTNQADVVIFGDYYIEGEKLIITSEVFDVLESRTKMAKYYSGEITADIFDTIDAITADLLTKIKQALPPLTSEEEVRIKKIRKNVYESSQINIRRMFYTRFGFYSEFGPKKLYYNQGNSGGSDFYETNTGNMPYTSPVIGLAFRLSDFRLDFMGSGLPGLPVYDWDAKSVRTDVQNISQLLSFSLVYYLPWFNRSLALGLGMNTGSFITKRSYQDGILQNETSGIPDFNFCVKAICNVNDNLELGLSVLPWFSFRRNNPYSDSPGSGNIQSLDFTIPTVIGSGIWFFGDFGLEGSFSFNQAKYTKINYSPNQTNRVDTQDEFTTLGLYVGMVYRVDFLK